MPVLALAGGAGCVELGLPIPGFLHVFVQAAGVLAWFRDVESVAYYFGVRMIVVVRADEVLLPGLRRSGSSCRR